MMLPPNQPFAIANLTQLAADLSRALDGHPHGAVSPDAIDDRGPKPVRVREVLTGLRERIDRFLA